MTGYIKAFKSFKTISRHDVDSYTLPLECNSTGTVTIPEELDITLAGGWFVLDGNVLLITDVTPKDGKTTLKLAEPVKAFDRTLLYPGDGASVGAFIRGELNTNFVNCSDTEYRLGYISVTNTDSTAFVAPDVDDDGFYVLSDYIEKVRKSGVWVRFQLLGASGLAVTIAYAAPKTRNVFAGDGHHTIDSQDYDRDMTAKVTVYQGTTATNYYMDADGNVGTAVPAHRAEGKWSVTTCGEEDDPLEAANEVFAENKYSYKIVFYSDRFYSVGDTIRIRFENGTVFSGELTGKTIQSSDSRIKYTMGILPVTLAEKIAYLNEVNK